MRLIPSRRLRLMMALYGNQMDTKAGRIHFAADLLSMGVGAFVGSRGGVPGSMAGSLIAPEIIEKSALWLKEQYDEIKKFDIDDLFSFNLIDTTDSKLAELSPPSTPMIANQQVASTLIKQCKPGHLLIDGECIKMDQKGIIS